MYIKSIEFHFTTDSLPFKVTGAEAQELCDSNKLFAPVVVTKELSIPQKMIARFEITPHREANQLSYIMDQKEREVRKRIIEADPFESLDMYILGRSFWTYDAKRIQVGCYEWGAPIIVDDPEIFDEAERLIELQKHLDALVGGSDGN